MDYQPDTMALITSDCAGTARRCGGARTRAGSRWSSSEARARRPPRRCARRPWRGAGPTHQHGPYSSKMALITSGCALNGTSSDTTAVTTSGLARALRQRHGRALGHVGVLTGQHDVGVRRPRRHLHHRPEHAVLLQLQGAVDPPGTSLELLHPALLCFARARGADVT